jgi:hypothetical protein
MKKETQFESDGGLDDLNNTILIIKSSKPWYHRLYQVLSNPFRWVFLGKIKYQ